MLNWTGQCEGWVCENLRLNEKVWLMCLAVYIHVHVAFYTNLEDQGYRRMG